MKDHHVPQEHLSAFARRLAEEERSAGTVEKYLRDAGPFWSGWRGAVNRERSTGLEGPLGPLRLPPRHHQLHAGRPQHLSPFHRPGGLPCPRLRVQRRLFQSEERELSRQEYQRLLDTALLVRNDAGEVEAGRNVVDQHDVDVLLLQFSDQPGWASPARMAPSICLLRGCAANPRRWRPAAGIPCCWPRA